MSGTKKAPIDGSYYQAICKRCSTSLKVRNGPGMYSMPLRCKRCGKEWWWEFGLGGPFVNTADPPPCKCGGTFTEAAPARCPRCRSLEWDRDPEGMEIIYD